MGLVYVDSAFYYLKAIWINASHLNPNIQLKRLLFHSRLRNSV